MRHERGYPDYAGSIGKYRDYLRQGDCAWGDDHRHANRCKIRSTCGTLMLTVPVEGGGSTLKRKGANPRVSEHGNWRHVHWQALLSSYGRSPYFNDYADRFKEIYSQKWDTLGDLCEEVDRCVRESLNLATLMVVFKDKKEQEPELMKSLVREANEGIDPEMSILDLLFHRGPAAIFALME